MTDPAKENLTQSKLEIADYPRSWESFAFACRSAGEIFLSGQVDDRKAELGLDILNIAGFGMGLTIGRDSEELTAESRVAPWLLPGLVGQELVAVGSMPPPPEGTEAINFPKVLSKRAARFLISWLMDQFFPE